MSQIIPINIPTYISDQNYNPSRVLPRLFYYNGLIDCETWYFESGSLTTSGVVKTQTSFPYFDNYNVVTGSFPTAGSKSLLFNNEAVAYGSLPSSSLFTEWWDTYVSLLYNPKTRLLTAKAIIPLADYVKMELNDIVNFRGNYYHLRAINNYSLKTGDCELQLLGPIIADTFSRLQPAPEPPAPPVSGAYAEVSWSFTESGADGNFKIYRNGSPVVTATTTTSGNLRVSGSDVINPELYPVSWTAGVTSSIYVNGGATISSVATTDTTLTGSFTAQTGSIYYITGSVSFTAPAVVTFYVGGGTYPATANLSAGGSIKNNTGSPIYVYLKFNSGGNTSGNVSSNYGSVDTTNLTMSGTVSGSGQTIVSSNYHTLPSDNTNYNWTVYKNDNLTSGATLRLAYSTTVGGTLTDLS